MDRVKNRLLAANVVGMFVLAYALMAGPGLAAPSQSSALATAVGTQISYQGRLSVADGPYDFIFRLWDAPTAGIRIGPDVTVDNAQVRATAYVVALNFGATAFTGEARWIEVYYRPGASTGTYTKLASRQGLLPTAYAVSLRPGAIVEGALANNTAVITANTSSPGAYGLKGFSQQSAGVFGQSRDGWGVWGNSIYSQGVYGQTYAENTSTVAGVYGRAIQTGGVGVIGDAQVGNAWGVYGTVKGGVGVRGAATTGIGVSGSSASGTAGVYGKADGATASGVEGNANASGAAGVYGKNATGRGVWGLSDSGTAGVFGQANGAGASGVEGYANGSVASAGVYGRSSNGVGVWGRNEAGGYAMKAEGHVAQSRESGGWVKAMVVIQPNGAILRCFNATLPGALASTLPCGITVTKGSVFLGDYRVAFPFQVDDRFFSVTPVNNGLSITASVSGFPTPSSVQIRAFNSWRDHGANEADGADAPFFLIVY